MGVLSRLLSLGRASRRLGAPAPRARELAGDLEGAAILFVEAGEPDEAARVLLSLADVEPEPRKKLAALARAAEVAPPDSSRRLDARRRSARVRLDLARADANAPLLRSEISRLAEELAALDEHEGAAEAYALAGDVRGEARELERAGDIERLERVLDDERAQLRARRERDEVGQRIAELDAVGRRREALAVASAWLAEHADDTSTAAISRTLRAKRLSGPAFDLVVAGAASRYLLGDAVTIGRGEATLVVSSPAVSRTHLRIARGATGIVVEDLGGRNGTWLAGARVEGALALHAEGLELSLGGEVPCRVTPDDRGGVTIEVAGERVVAPLGPLRAGPFTISLADDGAVELSCVEAGLHLVLGGLACPPPIELSHGDRVGLERGGPPIVEVPA